jgi:hypothetical protein
MVPAATMASLGFCWAFHRVVERHFLELPAVPSVRPLVQALGSVPAMLGSRTSLTTAQGVVSLGLVAGVTWLAGAALSAPTAGPGRALAWLGHQEARVACSVASGVKVLFLAERADSSRRGSACGRLGWREAMCGATRGDRGFQQTKRPNLAPLALAPDLRRSS